MSFLSLIDKKRRHEAWYALGVNVWHRYVIAVACVVAPAGLGLGPDHWLSPFLVFLALPAFFAPDRILRRHRARWVDRLDLPLDRESYAAALDGNSFYARMRITIEGSRLVMPEIHGIVAHVVDASPTRVVIESYTMQVGTHTHGYPAYNLELHRWFVVLTQQVLRPLAHDGRLDRIVAEHIPASRTPQNPGRRTASPRV